MYIKNQLFGEFFFNMPKNSILWVADILEPHYWSLISKVHIMGAMPNPKGVTKYS